MICALWHLKQPENKSKIHYDTLNPSERVKERTTRELTGNPVDCFERPQYPDCSDGRQVDVLQVQRVFDHPGETEEAH